MPKWRNWETRCLEGAVPAMACGFDSRLRHHELNQSVFIYNRKPIQDIRTAFHNACKRAGIKSLRFHYLRHTFATRLVLSGVDLATVSKLLGHSTIGMTMRYSHPTPEALKRAIQVLDAPKSGKSVSKSVNCDV